MTFKPTYQIVELSQRVANGDISAIPDLWDRVYPEVPFDYNWTLDDIAAALTLKFNEYNATVNRPDPEPEPEPDYSDGLCLFVGILVIVGVIMRRRRAR